jgi:hypothetical protein
LRLLEREPVRRRFGPERLEHAELHRGHDGAGDPETEEEFEHVVRIWY